MSSTRDAGYFTENKAYAGLGRASLHSGMIFIAARGANIFVQLASTILLARILSPHDFGVVAMVQLVSVIPLLGAPRGAVEAHAPGAWKAALRAAPIYLADGWMSGMGSVLWLAALFVTLRQSYAAYGGAMAAAALVGILFGLFLGRNIDRGHGARIVWITFGLVVTSYTARVLGVTPPLAVLANTIGAVVGFFYIPTLLTAAYNLSKGSPCQFRFQFVGEGAWDLGCASGCLVAAAVIWAGAPIHAAILLCFVGVAGSFLVLRRYYTGLAPALA